MKVNMRLIDKWTNPRTNLMHLMSVYLPQFAEEHNVSTKHIINFCLFDFVGRRTYCNWLVANKILNVVPYELLDVDDSCVALGFDLVEDELFTAELLKYDLTTPLVFN